MTLSDLARILRHSDFKDRLRHVDCDRRTIHLGSSFHRGLWTQGDFGTSMPFKSREESIPSSFGATGEARQAAIGARSTFFDERIRDGFSGLLWTAGAVSTRRCRHAATAHARSCQAEIAADTPLPPTASSKSKAVSKIRRSFGTWH